MENYMGFDLKFKRAFTLAEVLITLGIIGVVAAMVLPVMMNNVQDKVLETQRKKAASVLANGFRKMMADNEVFNFEELPLYSCQDMSCVKQEYKKVFITIADNFDGNSSATAFLPTQYRLIEANQPLGYLIPPAFAGDVATDPTVEWQYLVTFITPDGVVYGNDYFTRYADYNFIIFADVNGAKNPNIAGKDLVVFDVDAKANVKDVSCRMFYSRSSQSQCEAAGCTWEAPICLPK